MSKKILSLVLAVSMLLSVFVFSASAAVSSTQVGIWLETNAKAGMEAGESVWVKVYFTAPDTAGYKHGNSNVVLAFTDGFALDTTSTDDTACHDAREWGASYAEFFKDDSTVSKKSTVYTALSKKFTDNDKAKNWTGAVMVQQVTNTANGYDGNSGYENDPSCEVFTLNFKTTRKLETTDSIGVPEASVTMGQTLMKYINDAGKATPYTKSLDIVVIDEAVVYAEAAAVEYDVYNLGGKNGETAVKKVNKDGSYNIGTFFAFKAATIAPNFDATGKSANIDTITANVVMTASDGSTYTANAEKIRFVYDVSDAQDQSELGFVVAINGIPADNKIPDTDLTVVSYTITPVMTTNLGKTFTCETLTVNVADL